MELNGAKLKHYKKMSMNELKTFKEPKNIYIPVYNSKLKIGDYIYKGQTISQRERFNINVISSASGNITAIKEQSINGKLEMCYVVENDKEDKTKKITKNNNKTFSQTLSDAGIIGMGGAGFPASIKYNTDDRIETLLVNAVECEPYITADYTIMREKCETLLNYIEQILEINNIDHAILAIKKTNKEVINKFKKIINNYEKIELKQVRDIYPMGWEKTLIKETLKKEYDKLPIELGVVVNNISTINAIGEALNNNSPLTERIITVTGNIENPGNISVLIGTKVGDIIKKFGKYNKNSILISGGPMMGQIIDKETIITPEMNCILILNKIEEKETTCLRCAKCVSLCPAELHPILVKENIKNKEKLIKLEVNKCIGCGLCSYICPARIDLREFLKQAKEVIK